MSDLSPRYLATMNTPGYLPWSDDRMLFDTVQAAWEYLAGERKRQWDHAETVEGQDFIATAMTEAVREQWLGTIHGSTPGYDGSHDLGIAYTVTKVEHADYPHEADMLYDCPACVIED